MMRTISVNRTSVTLRPDPARVLIRPFPPTSDERGFKIAALSLRATGEGHISSITFRTGFVDAACRISVNAPTRYNVEPEPVPNAAYEKRLFTRKLAELALTGDFSRQALDSLGDSFTLEELLAAMD
jgi:hypothetical protein